MLQAIITIIVGVLVLIALGMTRSASKAGDVARAKTWRVTTFSLLALLVVCIAWLSATR